MHFTLCIPFYVFMQKPDASPLSSQNIQLIGNRLLLHNKYRCVWGGIC